MLMISHNIFFCFFIFKKLFSYFYLITSNKKIFFWKNGDFSNNFKGVDKSPTIFFIDKTLFILS